MCVSVCHAHRRSGSSFCATIERQIQLHRLIRIWAAAVEAWQIGGRSTGVRVCVCVVVGVGRGGGGFWCVLNYKFAITILPMSPSHL